MYFRSSVVHLRYKLYSSGGYGVTVNSKGGTGFRFGSGADISLCPERRRLVARKAGTVFIIQHRVGIAHTPTGSDRSPLLL